MQPNFDVNFSSLSCSPKGVFLSLRVMRKRRRNIRRTEIGTTKRIEIKIRTRTMTKRRIETKTRRGKRTKTKIGANQRTARKSIKRRYGVPHF